MKKSPKTVAKYTETSNKQIVIHDNNDDYLKLDDNDLSIGNIVDSCDEYSFIGKDIADGDVYNKETPFSGDLNNMQRNAIALHLEAVRREYAGIDQDDKHAVDDFWRRVKDRIHEDHGFMRKDIDAVTDILRKNVESYLGIPGDF